MRGLILLLLFSSSLKLLGQFEEVDEILDKAKSVFSSGTDSTKILANQALLKSSAIAYQPGTIRAYYYLGYFSQHSTHDLPDALRYYILAIKNFHDDTDSASRIWAYKTYVNSSNILASYQLNEKAIDLSEKALTLLNSPDNDLEINKILRNLSLIYFDTGEYQKCLDISTKLFNRVDSTSLHYYQSLNKIGIALTYLNRYDEAANYYKLLISESNNKSKRSDFVDFGYHNLADIQMKLGNWEVAKKLLDEQMDSNGERMSNLSKYGHYRDYLKLSINLHKPEAAYAIESKLLETIEAVRGIRPDDYFHVYKTLAEAFQMSGNDDKSTYYNELFLSDSVSYIQTKNAIDYESNRGELRTVVDAYYAELAEKKHQKETRNAFIAATITLATLLLILLLYQLSHRRYFKRIIDKSLSELDWKE